MKVHTAHTDAYTEAAGRLYNLCANNPLLTELPPVPSALTPSLKCVYAGAKRECPPIIDDGTTFTQPPWVDREVAVIGYTGGKDSLAAALCMREQGYDLVFLHVAGINPAYSNESSVSKMHANMLDARYEVVRVNIGKKQYLENPARNHTILLLQLALAVDIGAGTIVQGLHSRRVARDQPFHTGWSDCREMAEAGREMVASMCPLIDNRIDGLTQSNAESIDCVVRCAPDMLPMVYSCMQTPRFHAAVRKANRRKLGYDLLQGRCGSCHKCCVEWLVLREHGYYKESSAYREHVERLLVEKHSLFCYGVQAKNWERDKILAKFLSRPSGKK